MSDEIYGISVAYLALFYTIALVVIGAKKKAITTRGYYINRLVYAIIVTIIAITYTIYSIIHSKHANVSELLAIIALISIIEIVGYIVLRTNHTQTDTNDHSTKKKDKEHTWLA